MERYDMSSFWHWSFLSFLQQLYTTTTLYSIERTRTKPNAKSAGVFTSKTTSTTHDLTTKKRENLHIFFSVFPRLIVTRKLKIIVRSKESLNHSFLFDLNWCQIKRKREKRKRGWLYWPKSLKDKFFSCFHLYPYIILYVSMLLLGLFPFFFLYSSLWWQRSRWWSCWRWWI